MEAFRHGVRRHSSLFESDFVYGCTHGTTSHSTTWCSDSHSDTSLAQERDGQRLAFGKLSADLLLVEDVSILTMGDESSK